ncbi:very short patch repair endonuclease [Sphingomonas sp. MMS24-J45]|uniref:very short patch repair endonuclease n=1 Tax=Sphingomonas sp. MMS24-J45 TaxID=3238806 RepID=UPI00384E8B4D
MSDVHTPEQRSRNMAAVRGRDTKPELELRRALHGLGFRYRLNVRTLPGTPDLVLPARNALLFVHGCFWHGHDCPLFVLPRARRDFWLDKIGRNQLRDRQHHDRLHDAGWRIGTVWECAMRGRSSPGVTATAATVERFLRSADCREMYFRDNGAHAGAGHPLSLAERFGSAQVSGSDEGNLDRGAV